MNNEKLRLSATRDKVTDNPNESGHMSSAKPTTITQFTYFKKITNMADMIPNKTDRERFIVAVVEYGTKNIEPELEFPFDALFEGIRGDIDNSVRSQCMNKGGRKKKDAQNQPEETQKTVVSESENGGFQEIETGGFETEKPPISESENGGFQEIETQTKPNKAKPNQARPNHSRSRAAFKPPSPTEVAEYVNEKGLDIDAEHFCDFYQSKGWKIGKDTMKDWRAAARNWARRDNPTPKGGEDYAIYDKPVRVLRSTIEEDYSKYD